MRKKSPKIPLKKVVDVLPRPFNTLFKVVFKYKNGQIHESVLIKFPASSLSKRIFPRKSPRMRKKNKHPHPRAIQNKKELLMVFFRF